MPFEEAEEPFWLRKKNKLLENALEFTREQTGTSTFMGSCISSALDHHYSCKAANRGYRKQVNEQKEKVLKVIVDTGLPGTKQLAQHHYTWCASVQALWHDAVTINHAATLVRNWKMHFPDRGSTGFQALEDKEGSLGVRVLSGNRSPDILRMIVGLRNLAVFRGETDAALACGQWDLQKIMFGPCHFFGTVPTGSDITSYRIILPRDALTTHFVASSPKCSAPASATASFSSRSTSDTSSGSAPAGAHVSGSHIRAQLPDVKYEALRDKDARTILEQQSNESSSKPDIPIDAVLGVRVTFSDPEHTIGTSLTENGKNSGIIEFLEVKSNIKSDIKAKPRVDSIDSVGQEPNCFKLHVVNGASYNLQPFGAQVVENSRPFAIPGTILEEDDLQAITYWFGGDYEDFVLRKGDGMFLDTHDFAQTITPLQEDAGGYVLLARPRETFQKNGRGAGHPIQMNLVAVHIPFGMTLIIGKNTWHGDSMLKGLHMMGMTANHWLMESTEKTWFMKTTVGSSPVTLGCGLPMTRLENVRFDVNYKYVESPVNPELPCIPYGLEGLLSINPLAWQADEQSRPRIESWGNQDELIRKLPIWAAREWETADRARFTYSSLNLWEQHKQTLGRLPPVWPLRYPVKRILSSAASKNGIVDGPEVRMYNLNGEMKNIGRVSSEITIAETCELCAKKLWGATLHKQMFSVKLVPPNPNMQPGMPTCATELELDALLLDWFLPHPNVDAIGGFIVEVSYVLEKQVRPPYVPPKPQPPPQQGWGLSALLRK